MMTYDDLIKLLTLCNRSTAPEKSFPSLQNQAIHIHSILFISIAKLQARGRIKKWRTVQGQIGQSVKQIKQIKQIYAHPD